MKSKAINSLAKVSLLFGTGVAFDCLSHVASKMPSEGNLLGCPNEIMAGVLAIGADVAAHGIFEGWQKTLEHLDTTDTSPLEKVIIRTYNKTISAIRDEIIKEYHFEKENQNWIFHCLFNFENSQPNLLEELDDQFFNPLLFELINSETIRGMLNSDAHLNVDSYLTEIIRKTSKNFIDPGNLTLTQFTYNIIGKFKKQFEQHFIKELVENDNARNAYFIHLLEHILTKVTENYASQGEKLNFALNVLQDFKAETKASSELISLAFNSIRTSIGIMLGRFDQLDKQLLGLKELLDGVTIVKEVYIDKFIYVPSYFQDIDNVIEKWKKATFNEDTLLEFLNMLLLNSSSEQLSIAEELEQSFNAHSIKSKERSYSSRFGTLFKIRVALYARLLLFKKDLSDYTCFNIVQQTFYKAPPSSYASTLEQIHSVVPCTNSNRYIWSSIIIHLLCGEQPWNISDNYFYSFENYSFKNFRINVADEKEKVITGFASKILLERITSALIVAVWGQGGFNPEKFPEYHYVLDCLGKQIDSEPAEQLAAIVSYNFIFSSEFIKLSNFLHCRDQDKILLIQALSNPSISMPGVELLSSLLCKIFKTEY
jgi:hypothetical protein